MLGWRGGLWTKSTSDPWVQLRDDNDEDTSKEYTADEHGEVADIVSMTDFFGIHTSDDDDGGEEKREDDGEK